MAGEKTKLPRGGLQKVPTGIAGLAGADLLIQDPKELLSLVSSNPLPAMSRKANPSFPIYNSAWIGTFGLKLERCAILKLPKLALYPWPQHGTQESEAGSLMLKTFVFSTKMVCMVG